MVLDGCLLFAFQKKTPTKPTVSFNTKSFRVFTQLSTVASMTLV